MTITNGKGSFEQRLSQQLHVFSELSELLTLRILELEERCTALEKSKESEEDFKDDSASRLLEDSEQRVRHLQDLLDLEKKEGLSLQVIEGMSENKEEGSTFESSQSIGDNQEESFDELDAEYVDDSEMPLLSA